MKIESSMPEEERKTFKVVRRDSLEDVPGDIIWADEETGIVAMSYKANSSGDVALVTLDLSAAKIMIVKKYKRLG